MTDLEKWKQFLNSFGVDYTVDSYLEEEPFLRLEEGNKKVTGYTGFYTDVCFDKDGNFKEITCLE